MTIINDVEYANIHNEGGEVNPRVTEKMKRFAWYKVYSIAKIRKRKPGEKRRKKGTAKPLPPEAEMWKAQEDQTAHKNPSEAVYWRFQGITAED